MYSLDVRKIARNIYLLGYSLRFVSELMKISVSSIHRWVSNTEKKNYYRPSKKADTITEIIKSTILLNPFITVRAFVTLIKDSLNIEVSKELVRIVIKRLGFSLKKTKFFAKPKTLKERTETFIAIRDQYVSKNRYIVSLDETSFGRNGKPMYGYSKKGTQLVLPKEPLKVSKSTSVIVVIDHQGIVFKQSRSGPYNTLLFSEFMKSLKLPQDTVILLDNVSFHHSKVIKDIAIENKWELLYTPPYSPWFNPIEEAFSIVKRNYYRNWDIEKSFESLKPHHCNAFFNHSFQKC